MVAFFAGLAALVDDPLALDDADGAAFLDFGFDAPAAFFFGAAAFFFGALALAAPAAFGLAAAFAFGLARKRQFVMNALVFVVSNRQT